MSRQLTILMLLAWALVGCTLSTLPRIPETLIPTSIAGEGTVTPTITPTITPTPSPTPTVTPTHIPAPTLPNCSPRFDWPVYVVVGGDTLSAIARRVSSTTNQLAQANCLSNPNIISPGQQLRVPRLPPQDSYAGAIQVSPFIMAEGGAYTVRASIAINVSWPQARRDATRVEFYSAHFNNSGPNTVLGTDTFPNDGAAIPVTFPGGFQQAVYAIAYFANGSRQLTAERIPVFAIDTQENAPLIFSPNLGKEGDITLLPTGNITTTWPSSVIPQATHVEFRLIRNGSQSEFIGRDNNMADGAQITWQGGDTGTPGIHQFEAVAFLNSGIIGSSTARIRFQPSGPQVQGQVTVSPVLRTEGSVHVLEAGRVVTLTWQNAPVNQGSHFEFILIEDGFPGPRALGTDSNSADGVSISWTVPPALNNARIIAVIRAPGQNGYSVTTPELRVRPEAVDTPPGPEGQLVVSPIVRNENGWLVLQVGAPVTLSWAGLSTANVQRVEFYVTPTGTNVPLELVGTDTNMNDGVSISWTVPSPVTAHLTAAAFTDDGWQIVPVNNTLNLMGE